MFIITLGTGIVVVKVPLAYYGVNAVVFLALFATQKPINICLRF